MSRIVKAIAVTAIGGATALVPQAAFADDYDYPPPPPPRSATIAAQLTPACEGNVPFLYYDIAVKNVDPSITTATLMFTDGSHELPITVPLNSGRITWPGYEESNGEATAWPGFTFDPSTGTWQGVTDANFGWTRSTDVVVTVNPSVTVSVDYPEATTECAPTDSVVEVVDETQSTGGGGGGVVVTEATLSTTGFTGMPWAIGGAALLVTGTAVTIVAMRRRSGDRLPEPVD